MKRFSLKKIIVSLTTVVVISGFGLTRSQAADGIWTNTTSTINGNWSDPTKWMGGNVANGVSATAFITNNIGLNTFQTNTIDLAVTLGSLTFGDPASSYGTMIITNSGGNVLTMDNGGNGASITNGSGGNSKVDIMAVPISMNDNLTIVETKTGGGLTISGNITSTGARALTLITTSVGVLNITGSDTHTGGLTFNANGAGAITLSGSVNNSGAITNSGTSSGLVTISGGVGANVTSITETSATSALTISTTALTVNSGGTTLNNNNSSGSALLTVSGGVTGTGGLTLNNNSAIAGGITLSGTSVNNTGVITNSGTGSGSTVISAVIGPNVSGVVQNSAMSALALSGANTFSSGLTIQNGTVNATTSGLALGGSGSGAVTLGDSSGNADVTLSLAAFTYSNTVTVASGNSGIAKITSSGSAILTGAVSLVSHDLTLAPAATALTLNGGITGTGNLIVGTTGAGTTTLSFNSINMTGNITNNGAGSGGTTISAVIGPNVSSVVQNSSTSILSLSGANSSFTGGIYIKAGTVSASTTSSSLGNGTVYLGDTNGNANATLSLNTNLGYSQPLSVQGGNTGVATLQLNNNIAYSGPITLNNHDLSVVFASNGSESLTGSSMTGTGNVSFVNNNNNTPTVSDSINIVGSISMAGSSGGNGVVLSGNNTYTGTATVSVASFWFQKYQAWSQNAGGVANTPTAVTVSNGTTLAITYGAAAGAFADANVASLLANSTFGSTATLRLDDGASSTTSNMATVIGSAAGMPQNVTRTGSSSGILLLTGANTYSGVTTLTSGGYLGAGVAENAGVSGPFGKPTTLAGSIVFNGGGLAWSAANNYDYSSRFAINSGSPYKFDANGQNVTLASALPANGVNALTVVGTGGGKVILSGNNVFGGSVSINTGNLSVDSLNYVDSGTWAHHADGYSNLGAPTNAANGQINLGSGNNAGTLTYTGSGETTDRNILMTATAGGNPTSAIDQLGTGLLKFTGTLSFPGSTGTSQLSLQGIGDGEISGVIGGAGSNGSIMKNGTNTWTFSNIANTYQGKITINSGIFAVTKVADGGVLSSLGTNTSAAANLVINGGTLQYIGTGDSMNRNWTLGNSGAALDASGSGALTMSGTNVYVTANQARTNTFTGTSTALNTYGGNLVNNGSGLLTVVKDGVGTWALTGANTYTGPTTIKGGTLLINGSLLLSSAVTVNSGGTLGGTGTVGAVTVDGTLSPGNSPGTLTVSSLTLNSTAHLNYDLDTPSTSDKVFVSGGLTLNGQQWSDFTFLNAGGLTNGTYVLIDATTGLSGSLGAVVAGALPGGYNGTLSVDSGNYDLLLTVVIPEPTARMLVVIGMAAMVGLLRFRSRPRTGYGAGPTRQ